VKGAGGILLTLKIQENRRNTERPLTKDPQHKKGKCNFTWRKSQKVSARSTEACEVALRAPEEGRELERIFGARQDTGDGRSKSIAKTRGEYYLTTGS